jgi:hypothetical protein
MQVRVPRIPSFERQIDETFRTKQGVPTLPRNQRYSDGKAAVMCRDRANGEFEFLSLVGRRSYVLRWKQSVPTGVSACSENLYVGILRQIGRRIRVFDDDNLPQALQARQVIVKMRR